MPDFRKRLSNCVSTKSALAVVLAYLVVFHVIYGRYWKSDNKKTHTAGRSWSLMTFWKEGTLGADDDDDILHIHLEHPVFGHTGEILTESTGKQRYRSNYRESIGRNSVAIGSGLTSKGLSGVNETNIASKFQLFFTFIPTFCDTASPDFDYHFYFSYDSVDQIFANTNFLWAFQKTFLNATRSLCPRNMTVDVHMVQCSHTGKPTWAQNDAMLEAYLDNIEYYYRINDDTQMITKNWTQMFIEVLRNYKPSNVGVVGPNHSGGNTAILTYDFVHRTHVDVFGFYYPRLFTDWWGDDWVTLVYRPKRSTKLQDVRLAHTLGMGQRYGVNWNAGNMLQGQLAKDMIVLNRYINYTISKDSIKVDGRKVISMSLYGSDPKYTWGAIRNAQIAPIFFPGWKLRVYVTSRSSKAAGVKSWLVPKRIVSKLKQLGAEIAYVKTKSIAPVFWRYLVVDDQTVDYFLVRDTDSRLSERDAAAVNDWLQHQDLKSHLNSLHCIRDHPDHANLSIVDGLWGGNRAMVRRRLGRDMSDLLDTFSVDMNHSQNDWSVELIYRLAMSHRRPSSGNVSFSILSDIVWPLMRAVSYCHDSVSCERWPNSQLFPVVRTTTGEYLGQPFDEHQEIMSNKNNELLLSEIGLKCTNATLSETTTQLQTTTRRRELTTTAVT